MILDSLKTTMIFPTLVMFAVICTAGVCFAQEKPETPELIEQNSDFEDVPPPLIRLSNEETAQLSGATEMKKRTSLCLQLATNRLTRAETLTTDADFQNALAELAGYQAVIDDSIKYLQSQKNDSRRMRDNLRRLEIMLRGHAPRLETIRRSTPSEYSVHLKPILLFARDARTRALDTFYSDAVVANELSTAPAKRDVDNLNPVIKQP